LQFLLQLVLFFGEKLVERFHGFSEAKKLTEKGEIVV